jgi:SAM-dependent methyltransferase
MPNTIYIDSTHCPTDLCLIGSECNTDKSPYSLNSVCSQARKGYTAVYELLFSSMRNKEINFCEIGIEAGASVQMWEQYFSNANLFAFEYDENKIELCKKLAPNTNFSKTDVSNEQILDQTFKDTDKMFDIIIDDSNHHQPDQLKILKVAVNYLKPGGILVIEDIYREYTEDIFDSAIGDEWAFKAFIICDHKNRSGHDNDKIWVGIKK